MEHGARLSTSRVMAIAFIFMSVLIVLSLSVNIIQGVNNYRLQNEQRTAVTPMAFNSPFAVSQNSADASYLQQMALSFIALRLNVSSETVDASHQALLQYIRPGAQNQMKVILAEEAKRIKNDNVNSAFFQTSVRVWPQYGRVEIRGVLKTWIGDSKPFTDICSASLPASYWQVRAWMCMSSVTGRATDGQYQYHCETQAVPVAGDCGCRYSLRDWWGTVSV
ncbi:type IV conjugative transfer system protein TraE [Escherichia coli]|uniref:type IV conjugative transfer system protein TraE n=4 Tax=Escherichia coli TaxID=562 RepID=UPI00201A41BD|nr:type IV conjugative transfer system protein TraE [Escherichia coli]